MLLVLALLSPPSALADPGVDALRPPSAYEVRQHGAAYLFPDGDQVAVWDFREGAPWVFVGPVDEPVPTPFAPTGDAGWLRPLPGEDGAEAVLVVDRDGAVRRLAPGSRDLGAIGGVPFAQDRTEEGWRLWVAGDDGGVRVWRASAEGVALEHDVPGADDVVLAADGSLRWLVSRETRRHGQGVSYDVLQVWAPGARPGRALATQPAWVRDRGPSLRVGDGPVHWLAVLEDKVGVVRTGEAGLEPVWTPSWADATRWVTGADGSVRAFAEDGERLRWQVEDAAVGADLAWLREALDADVDVLDAVDDDRVWMVEAWSGTTYPRTWVFDRDARTLHRHGVRYGRADRDDWRPVEAFVLEARDGLRLPAYLTRPDPTRWGAGPHPTVLTVHGGPWSGRHGFLLHLHEQRLADRGYATVAVDFRGTRGFGWAQQHAARFGGEMVGDLHDLLDHAVAQGWTDPARIAVEGASYGGYAALRLATEPEPRVRCALAGLVYGNLTTGGGGLVVRSVGSLRWRRAHSPDRFTENLTGPVLVWTGGLDGDNPDSIEDFVQRAQRHGKAVTWVRFPDEGHGLRQPDNRDTLVRLEDAFLGSCLGGPSWPLGTLEGSAELRADGGTVPGLAEALGSAPGR